jgi:carotenoid 1,2-hydratase
VFSPYYVWAGRRDPEDHCAVNVALYGPGVGRWTMTERRRRDLARDATTLAIGPSALRWTGDSLVIDLAEWSAPLPRPVRGRITLHPHGLAERRFSLDPAGVHHWMAIAPSARVEVAMSSPGARWSGHGYWDTNAGDEPLERGFRYWSWSRAAMREGAALLYDMEMRDGSERQLAVRYRPNGEAEDFEPPPRVRLPGTLWRIRRTTQAERPDAVKVRRTLEDTPFYARSELATRLLGEDVPAVHESLDCDRFDRLSTRLMLPWRMPRRFV